jgi:hypothetical protein
MDSGRLGGLAESGFFNASFVKTGTDEDQIRGYNTLITPPAPFSATSWSVGADLNLATSNALRLQYASSSYSKDFAAYSFPDPSLIEDWNGKPITGYTRKHSDMAWAAQLTQPLGLMSLALDLSYIGPLFYAPAGGIRNQLLITGPEGDPASSFYGSPTMWANPLQPKARLEDGEAVTVSSEDARWKTDIGSPVAFMGNSQKYGLSTEVGWSFVNLRVLGGVIGQINPTGPWITTSPYLEGGSVGYMLESLMGGNYYFSPPPSNVGSPPTPIGPENIFVNTGYPAGHNVGYYQQEFNRVTDAPATPAVFEGANEKNRHWHYIGHSGYRSMDFTVMLSKQGIGDNRILGTPASGLGYEDKRKFTNYLAADLKFDFQSLFGRTLPFEVLSVVEIREVSASPGLPKFSDPAHPRELLDGSDPEAELKIPYFTQTVSVGYLTYGITSMLSVVTMAGYETWRSNHSYQPLNIVVREFGVGFDLDMAPFLSGLDIIMRSRVLDLRDSFFGMRNFSAWETQIGTQLNF